MQRMHARDVRQTRLAVSGADAPAVARDCRCDALPRARVHPVVLPVDDAHRDLSPSKHA